MTIEISIEFDRVVVIIIFPDYSELRSKTILASKRTKSIVKMTGTTLIPVRVDFVTDDKSIRIVDTLLFDHTCFPITLYQPLYASVEENVTEIAHTIISDNEVQVSFTLYKMFSWLLGFI
ncbi:MAG: hypothetical protein ACI90V_012447 [Bacillariaceae sp.]